MADEKKRKSISAALERANKAISKKSTASGSADKGGMGGIQLIPANKQAPTPEPEEKHLSDPAAEVELQAETKPAPEPMTESQPAAKPETSQPPAALATNEAKEPVAGAESVDFGMVDLGGSEGGEVPTLDRMPAAGGDAGAPPPLDQSAGGAPAVDAPAASEAGRQAPRPAPSGAPQGKPAVGDAGTSPFIKDEERKASERGESRYEPYVPPKPRRSYAKEIKIGLIILAVLAVIGGAVFGIVKWREGVEAERMAEKDRLNSTSLDSLRDEAVKKERFE